MPTPAKAEEIFDKSRSLLNDQVGAVFTDTVLLPYLQMADTDLMLECEDNNIPYTNLTTSDPILIPAGIRNIGGDGTLGGTPGPALPEDLVEIVEMYERISGTTNDYLLMRRRNFLPKTNYQTQYLEVYTWQKQTVQFIGSTTNIEVTIDYVAGDINDITGPNSLILLFNARSFLWFRTAAHAAFYIGENKERSDELNAEALRCIETMENIGIKSQQSSPVRRRPFMSSYRQRGLGGYQI